MRNALLPLFLLSCSCADTVATTDRARIYALVSLHDEPFAPRATISFGPDGKVSGQAPCNRWSAQLTQPLPVFAIDGITATEMACDALQAEGIFFDALMLMTQAEITDQTVTLRGSAGYDMVFHAVADQI